jgi:hypothetical protein
MDEIVKAAMLKWPKVPAVYGWLSLTARGEWKVKGEPIDNESICDFINRNYTNDGSGNWFFQNGPQRVYVSLESTPYVYRLDEFGRLQAHTGAHPREMRAAFSDPAGRLFIETEFGPGIVDSADMVRFSERVVDRDGNPLDEGALGRFIAGDGEAYLKPDGLHVLHEARVPIERTRSQNLGETFGFVAEPGEGKVT